MSYTVAVVGATGAVGQEMLKVLEERAFPVKNLIPLASIRSKGKTVSFKGQTIHVRELTETSFRGVQLALFSAGGGVSKKFAPIAGDAEAIVVDNTSAFRMNSNVPLVVPEVNPHAVTAAVCGAKRRIIANPNCSTIQMVVALCPIQREAGIKRIVVSTYQAVSGAGKRAMEELSAQAKAWSAGNPLPPSEIFPKRILFNCLPQIGDFVENGNSVEEEKMIHETRKIFDLPNLAISATTVRVPVMIGHSESVNVETERPLSAEKAKELLQEAPGVELVDDTERLYPLATQCAGTDPVYVGRVRVDSSVRYGLNLWIVADNLRKGAALNAVQVAELCVEKGLL